ncbi:probable carboxylesterase 2 [Amborella trichopoda]|uniref:probable carboxylesterase 2 n=1 Tax=Amborella trichopoda TaxID=13333 RepID=UPI0005D3F5F6|nr:probable carboxylesterase 2 [Amborella trichopoda]|eukprot:XP_011627929.1 probable carboxylesterase 2 [Amborella trichopoda]
MASPANPKGILHEFPPFIRIYKDGTVELLIAANGEKLTTLLYFQGGAFVIESAFSPFYHRYLDALSAKANALIISVDYCLAPDHPLSTAYDDAWAAFQWIMDLSDPWLRDHADLDHLFLARDSAGANIAHRTTMRAGKSTGARVRRLVTIHPFFWGTDLKETARERSESVEKMSRFVCPKTNGLDDPQVNPGAEALERLGCRNMLVCVAGKDMSRERGRAYYEDVRRSGWEGVAEVMEIEEEDHIFHLFRPDCDNASLMMEQILMFLNND